MTATRTTLYNVLLSIGGLLNFVLKFSIIWIGNRQHFAMATNFMRKIYSVDSKSSENKEEDAGQARETMINEMGIGVENLDESGAGQDEELHSYEQGLVKKEIESRDVFEYTYGRFWLLKKFDKKCCLCCRPERKREDFLYKGARNKLNEELDILEIVKKLRVH